MRAKLWRYFKIFIGILLLFKLFHRCEHRAWAQGHSYFGDSDLDYWREGKKIKPFVQPLQPLQAPKVEIPKLAPSGSIIRQSDAFPFDWKNYEDPKSPEFWDDGGDYVAPRPLREVVVNPTSENLERYAAWQAKRLVVIAEFNQKLLAHELAKGKASSSSPSKNQRMLPQKAASNVNLREVSLMYFYQSSCPHCQASREQVEDLRRKGVQVTFVQLDADENAPLHSPSVPYSAALSKQFAITATPTWIFRRHEKVLRLQGEQSEKEILEQISAALRPQTTEPISLSHNEGVSQ